MADNSYRLNGAKSKSPIKPEGKILSSQNSLRHGLCSVQVVLPHELDEQEQLAWTFDHLANHNKSLQLLIRYEGNLNRTYERALKQLQVLQSMRGLAPAGVVRNEPDSPGPSLCPQPNEPKEDPETTPEVLESAAETPEIPESAGSGEPNSGSPAPQESN